MSGKNSYISNARIEENLNGKYFVVKLEDETKAVAYQMEMLSQNAVPGMAKLSTRVNNGETELWYDISSCKGIAEVADGKITKDQFVNLFGGITEAVQASDRLFLDQFRFVLDREVLFVDKDMKPHLIYLPLEDVESDLTSDLRALFGSASQNVEVAPGVGDMLQVLSREINDDSFNVKAFAEKLGTYTPKKAPTKVPSGAPVSTSTPAKPVIDRMAVPIQAPNKPAEPQKIPEIKTSESSLNAMLGRTDGGVKASKPKKEKKERQAKNSGGSGNKAVLLTVLVQVVVIAALAGLYVSGLLESLELTQKLGLLLLIVAVDGYAVFKIKQMPVPEGKPVVKEKAPKKGNQPKKAAATPAKQASARPTPAPSSEATEFLNEETAFMSEEAALLRGRTQGFEGDFFISASPFVVGKSKEGTNISVPNKHVSRHHLQIVNNAGQFLISDLGSTNGTFLNGSRIEANLQYPLNSGDLIKIGQCEYEFIIL